MKSRCSSVCDCVSDCMYVTACVTYIVVEDGLHREQEALPLVQSQLVVLVTEEGWLVVVRL